MTHKGPRLFITGIPTSGKTRLARQLAKRTGGIAIHFDEMRRELAQSKEHVRWVNFYLDQDEKKYLIETAPEKQWENLVAQSENFWPVLREKIDGFADERRAVIFECVNLLPSLASKDFNFPGIVLLGSSFEKTFERNKRNPRWGGTENLQRLEAETFFTVERPRYKEDGDRHGWRTFTSIEEAIGHCLSAIAPKPADESVVPYMTQRDNNIWFKRKLYGWGWVPVTWQGWLATAVYAGLISAFALTVDESSPVREIMFTFILPLTLLTIAFARIAYKKGERPRWQWGKEREK